jgi:glutathione synthase
LGEKLLASGAPELMPPSLVASSFADFAAFGAEHALTVAKPLHDCQSHGVELLDWERDERTGRCASVLGALTDGYRRPALLQRFLPAVVTGETRLWLLDAKLLCAVRKRPAQGTFRIDMDKGGTLEPCLLSAAEQRKVPLIEALLARQRVRLAAVDLIDGWVTDCNVTSPGLLAQMETVLGANLARPIIETLLGPYGARSVRADGPESDRRHLAAPRSEEASPVDEGRPDQRASSKRPRVDSTSATVSSTGAGRASR